MINKSALHKQKVQRLLRNDIFILWCLIPTSSSEEAWLAWEKEHPQHQDVVNEAKEEIQSLCKNRYRLSHNQSDALWVRIEEKSRRLQKKRWKQWLGYAAVILLLLSFPLGYQINRMMTQGLDLASIHHGEKALTEDTNEIELLLWDQQRVILENRTEIKSKPSGELLFSKPSRFIPNGRGEKCIPSKKKAMGQWNKLKVPYGRRATLVLEDGTKIWANAGTTISFPAQFEEMSRTIYVDGELFLEVSKDPKRPFLVKSDQLDVRVLGTAFGISTASVSKHASVVLLEGSVDVFTQQGASRRMSPNEKIRLEEDHLQIKEVDAHALLSWKDDVLRFDGKTLNDLLNTLARYYRVIFHCEEALKQTKCSGSLFLFDDIREVLETLEEILPFSLVINGDEITILKSEAYE